MDEAHLQPVRGHRFAGFSLELAKRRLKGPDGAAVPLSSRAYDVLAHLVENRDRVVGKDELIKVVWPRSVVEENNLNQAISRVRRALGDSRGSPRFIVTIAGRGYQFIGDVSPLVRGTAMSGDATDAIQHGSSGAPVPAPESPLLVDRPRTHDLRWLRATPCSPVSPSPSSLLSGPGSGGGKTVSRRNGRSQSRRGRSDLCYRRRATRRWGSA